MDRSTLNKATSADDTPTPGYLCTEIAQATHVDPTACQTLADYLLKKLERDNPHVKAKVLRLVRFVCDNGKAEFRRLMQRKADVVKACLQYRGQPDPLRGDALNKAVREAADAAVKSIFSADTSLNAYGVRNDGGKKLQSFGSEATDDLSSHIGTLPKPGGGGSAYGGGSSFSSSGGMGGPTGPKSYSAGGMVGFGNDPSDVPGQSQNDTMFKTAMSNTLSAVSKLTSMVPGISHGDKASPELPGPSTGAYRAPPAMPTMGSAGPWGQGSGTSGGFGSAAAASKNPVSSKSSGEYEARVVAEICTPGGARVAPSAAALQEFVQKCESLDATAVGEQLGQRLGSADWQTKAKALYAVESLAQNNLDGIVGHLSQFYSAQLFEAQKLPQCQQKATKVLVLLGLTQDEEPRGAAPAAAASALVAAPVTDLLDFGDPEPPAPVADLGGGGSADLVGAAPIDLLEASSSPVPGLGAPAAAAAPPQMQAAPAQQMGDGGLFGGLSMQAPQPAQEVAAPAPAGQPSLLASLEAQSQAQQQQMGMAPGAMQGGMGAQGSNPGLFANLSMSSGPTYAAQGPMPGAPMQPSPMSGFPGMMGGPAAPMQPQMGAPQQVPQAGMQNPAMGGPLAGGMQPANFAPQVPGNFGAAGGMPGASGPGMSSGSAPGSAFGFIGGAAPGPAAGPAMPAPMQPGMQQGMQPGMQAPMQPGMQVPMQPGMQPGMQQGMMPGMMSAMQPGMQGGMQPGMAPAMASAMGGPSMQPSMPPPSAMQGPWGMAGPMGMDGRPAQAAPNSKEQPAPGDNAFNFVSEQMKMAQSSGHSAAAPALECH